MLGINRKTLGRTPKRLILTVVLQNNKKSAVKQNKLNIDGMDTCLSASCN